MDTKVNKEKKMKKKRKIQKRMYKGLPLIDATKDLEICVTKRDVSISRKNDPASCAAANAIKRETKAVEAEVHISRTYIKQGNKWIRFITPQSISREITSFDRLAIFEPGTYNLKAPSVAMLLGQGRKSKRGPHTTSKPKPYHHTVNIRESAK